LVGWFILRPMVSRPVYLGIRLPFAAHDQILSFPFFWQILCCSSCRAPSLTRGRVCNLQCNRCLVRSLRTSNHTFKVKVIVIFRPTVSRPIHLGTRRPSGTRDQFFPILSLISFLTFSGLLMWGALYGEKSGLNFSVFAKSSQVKLLYNWRSVSQYVLVSSPIWDFWPEIYIFFLKVTVLSYLGCPLWREVGSVICQSFIIIVCSSISMNIQFTLCVTHSSQLNTIKYNRIKNLLCVIHIDSKPE
jgi:hypothetical protein